MAFETNGLTVGVISSVGIALVLLVLAYYFSHKNRISGVLVYKVYRPKRPWDPPTFFNFGGFDTEKPSAFLRSLLYFEDPWLESNQASREAHVYFTYLRLMVGLFAIIGVACPALLLPVYATQDYREDRHYSDNLANNSTEVFKRGVADLTAINIAPDSGWWWYVFGVTTLVAYEVCATMVRLLHELYHEKLKIAPFRTAQVFNIAGETREGSEAYIWSHMPNSVRSRVTHIVVPERPPKGMLDYTLEQRDLRQELREWYAHCQVNGISLQTDEWRTHPDLDIRAEFCGNLVNAIEYNRRRIENVEGELRTMMNDLASGKYSVPVGTGFVTFSSALACAEFVARRNVGGMYVTYAYQPTHMLWDNLDVSMMGVAMRRIPFIIILLALAFVQSSLIAILGDADTYATIFGPLGDVFVLRPAIKELMQSFAPVTVVAIITTLLPLFLRPAIMYVERLPNKIARERRVMQSMTAFGLITAVFVQAALQGSGEYIWDVFNEDFDTVFNDSVIPTTGYFVLQVVSAAFVGNMVRLLRPFDLILGPMLHTQAHTRTALDYSYDKRAFFFSEEYSISLINFGFAILFSVSVPYIPFFGFFYFLIKFMVDRALLCDSFPACRKSQLELVPVCIRSIFLVLIAWLGVTTAMFFIRGRYDTGIAAVALCVSAIIVAVRVHLCLDTLMGPKFLTEELSLPVLPRVFGLMFSNEWQIMKKTGLREEAVFDDTRSVDSLTDVEDPTSLTLGEVRERIGKMMRAGAAEQDDGKWANVPLPDFSINGISAYEHPCKKFLFVGTDHEYEIARKWAISRHLATDVPSKMIVKPCVYFRKPKKTQEDVIGHWAACTTVHMFSKDRQRKVSFWSDTEMSEDDASVAPENEAGGESPADSQPRSRSVSPVRPKFKKFARRALRQTREEADDAGSDP